MRPFPSCLHRAVPAVSEYHRQGGHGYRGLAEAFPGRVLAPPPAPRKDAPAEAIAAYRQACIRQSSGRICVEHAIAEYNQWRPLQRYLGRREAYAEVYLAIASLVSDWAARRSIRDEACKR